MKQGGVHATDDDLSYYNFTPRGLVDMKGKGELYTYWLDRGTDLNQAANPVKINELARNVSQLLASETWKKRRYFRKNGTLRQEYPHEVDFTDSTRNSSGWSEAVEAAANIVDDASVVSNESPSLRSDEGMIDVQGADFGVQVHGIVCRNTMCQTDHAHCIRPSRQEFHRVANHRNDSQDGSELSKCRENGRWKLDRDKSDWTSSHDRWYKLRWGDDESTHNLVSKIQELLFSRWQACNSHPPSSTVSNDHEGVASMKHQLFAFVQRMSTSCNENAQGPSFSRVCHAVLCASYLWEQVENQAPTLVQSNGLSAEDSDHKWNRFIIVFAALIFGFERSNRNILHVLELEFPEIYEELAFSCPTTLLLVHKARISSPSIKYFDRLKNIQRDDNKSTELDKAICYNGTNQREVFKRTAALMDAVLALADIGHYLQDFESCLLKWTKHDLLQEKVLSQDLSTATLLDQIKSVFMNLIHPLINRIELLAPQLSHSLRTCLDRNVMLWEESGEAWIRKVSNSRKPLCQA
jgi:hypothetical protein